MITMNGSTDWNFPALIFSQTASLRRVALNPAAHWVHAQGAMLDCLGERTEDWVERRRQATEAALHALDRLSGAQDFGAFAQAYVDWMNGAVQRAQDATVALGETASAVLQTLLGGVQDAAEAAVNAASGAAEPVAEAAKRTGAKAARVARAASGDGTTPSESQAAE